MIGFEEFQKSTLTGENGFFESGNFKIIRPDSRGGAFSTLAEIPEYPEAFAKLISKIQKSAPKLGIPRKMAVVEIGPGEGNFLKALHTNLQAESVESIVVGVERGLGMLKKQKINIGTDNVHLVQADAKHIPLQFTPEHTTIVIANEILDNLPVNAVRKMGDHFEECCIDNSDEANPKYQFRELTDADKLPDYMASEMKDGQVVPVFKENPFHGLGSISSGPIIAFFHDYFAEYKQLKASTFSIGPTYEELSINNSDKGISQLRKLIVEKPDLTHILYLPYVVDLALKEGFIPITLYPHSYYIFSDVGMDEKVEEVWARGDSPRVLSFPLLVFIKNVDVNSAFQQALRDRVFPKPSKFPPIISTFDLPDSVNQEIIDRVGYDIRYNVH